MASLPKIPTVDEAGLKGFEVSVWHALYAPKGTPKPIIDALTKALQVALKDNIVKQRFADLGTEPVAEKRATPEALRAHLKAEIDKWAPIIKKAGVFRRLSITLDQIRRERPDFLRPFFCFRF